MSLLLFENVARLSSLPSVLARVRELSIDFHSFREASYHSSVEFVFGSVWSGHSNTGFEKCMPKMMSIRRIAGSNEHTRKQRNTRSVVKWFGLHLFILEM